MAYIEQHDPISKVLMPETLREIHGIFMGDMISCMKWCDETI